MVSAAPPRSKATPATGTSIQVTETGTDVPVLPKRACHRQRKRQSSVAPEAGTAPDVPQTSGEDRLETAEEP